RTHQPQRGFAMPMNNNPGLQNGPDFGEVIRTFRRKKHDEKTAQAMETAVNRINELRGKVQTLDKTIDTLSERYGIPEEEIRQIIEDNK
ncbi:MAG: hypothetical protein ABEJ96_01895, partial [Thiohalorhabdaceae bacterium]